MQRPSKTVCTEAHQCEGGLEQDRERRRNGAGTRGPGTQKRVVSQLLFHSAWQIVTGITKEVGEKFAG
jgi:hypothetical protein